MKATRIGHVKEPVHGWKPDLPAPLGSCFPPKICCLQKEGWPPGWMKPPSFVLFPL